VLFLLTAAWTLALPLGSGEHVGGAGSVIAGGGYRCGKGGFCVPWRCLSLALRTVVERNRVATRSVQSCMERYSPRYVGHLVEILRRVAVISIALVPTRCYDGWVRKLRKYCSHSIQEVAERDGRGLWSGLAALATRRGMRVGSAWWLFTA
jgi:hypothetical protein